MSQRRRVDRPTNDKLREMYVECELGTTTIARTLGCEPSTVRYWLLAADIDMRSKSESAKIRAARGRD